MKVDCFCSVRVVKILIWWDMPLFDTFEKKLLLSADLIFVKIGSHINVIFATIYFITASKLVERHRKTCSIQLKFGVELGNECL